MKTKEEIIDEYIGQAGWTENNSANILYVDRVLELMQAYADQQTAELRTEVERLKEELETEIRNNAIEWMHKSGAGYCDE